jgi:hypothetical protein
MTRRQPLLPLLIATGIIILMLMPLPSKRLTPWPALYEAAENLCHPIVFGMFAAWLARYLRGRHAYTLLQSLVVTLLACVTLGGLTEWLQSWCGRDGSWSDLLGDTLGSLAALCGGIAVLRYRAGEPAGRMLWPGIAAFMAAVIAVKPFLMVVGGYTERAVAAPVFWRADSKLLNQFGKFVAGNYPGLVLQEPPPDWRGYRYLVIDVTNEGVVARALQLRVHDVQHDGRYTDRFHAVLMLPPGGSRHRIDLNEVRAAPQGRPMQMRAIRGLALFVRRPETLRGLRIEQLALER